MKNQIYLLFVFILSGNILSALHFEILPINKEFNISMKYCLALDSKNNIYVGTNKGLLAFKEDKWNLIQFNVDYNAVKKIFIDSKDRVWCIVNYQKDNNIVSRAFGRLYGIDQNANTNLNPKIATASINDIVEDANGVIWVSTGKIGYKTKGKKNLSGIYQFSDSTWTQEIIGGFTEKIVQTSTKLFFLDAKGSGDKGYWFVNGELKELDAPSFWGNQRVLDIAESADGKTWVCTAENRFQIFSMDEQGELTEALKTNPYRYGPGGGFVKKNENLYLTYLGMFLAYDEKTSTWIYPKKQSNQKLKFYIRDIEETSEGSVLIATGEGIKTYKNGTISDIEFLDGKKVTLLHKIKKNTFIVGTKGDGLFLLKDNELTPREYDSNGKTMPETFTKLITNDNKVLVLNTSSGILKITID